VLTELPPRTDIALHVKLNESEAALYDALRREAVRRVEGDVELREGERQFKILAELMKLRRACCHSRLVLPSAPLESSKLHVFGKVLDELLENDHKALVFSQFVDHLDLVRAYLDGRGVKYQYLDGSTPTKERHRRVQAFQAGESELFLISLRAGGTGLNLTAADYVIHMDPWWNPAVEDQASDRAHRIGQERPVTVYRLITQGTIEEQIVQLHADKRELADSLLAGTETSGRLSSDDLLHLLRGGGHETLRAPAAMRPVPVRTARTAARLGRPS
jgi:SNF2 family DNA or RNA helicase